jgi:hypothetical protein
MTTCRSLVLAAVSLAAATAQAAAPAASTPYQPLAYLVGHCWRGTFPDGKVSDEHCFTWIYGGKFVRDVHVVDRGAAGKDQGESIYLWDAGAGQLQYLYIESAGGFSRGSVAAEGNALVFPPTHYREGGQEQVYRSRWQRLGEDAYDVVTEFQVEGGGWGPGFTVHMKRVGPAG